MLSPTGFRDWVETKQECPGLEVLIGNAFNDSYGAYRTDSGTRVAAFSW